MNIPKVLALALALALALPQSFARPLKYKNPTGKEFPILAWFSILGDKYLTHERYQELRDAGFNISFSHFASADDVEKGLKAAKGTGVKFIVTTHDMQKNTEQVVARLKDDPQICGWFLRDEPSSAEFDDLRKFRDRVLAVDSKRLLYLNLFPCFVNPAAIADSSYESHMERFVDKVAISQISYDLYPIVDTEYKIYVRPELYANLEIARRVSLKKNMPFWAFCLATPHMVYPMAADAHLRLEAFTALAYGAQCIQYFTYFTPQNADWDYRNGPIDADGNRTGAYYRVKRINREIQGLRNVFLGAKAVEVSCTGSYMPPETHPLTKMPEKFTSITSDLDKLLVSELQNGRRHYVMIVNRSIDDPQTVSLSLNKGVTRVYPCGKSEKLGAGSHTIALTPGNYAIFRTK